MEQMWTLLSKCIEGYKPICMGQEDWLKFNAWAEKKGKYFESIGFKEDWEVLVEIASRQIREMQMQNFPNNYY